MNVKYYIDAERYWKTLEKMIYDYAEYNDRKEVAYIEKFENGFLCVLPNRLPLFDEPHTLHDKEYWKQYLRDNNLYKVEGRFITLSNNWNSLVFRKREIDLTEYLTN